MFNKTGKNQRRVLSAILFAALLISGCGAGSSGEMSNETQMQELNSKLTVSEDIPDYNTTYEIFLSSFYDSDGDGIGDLKGVTEKLDYINDGDAETDEDLGCNAIWLTPVCPSPTYHKYDVTDYVDIDPSFGTLDDYKTFVDECHKRGIKVLFDMVMNHTSSEHPWFKEATDYLKGLPKDAEPSASDCKYYGYYNFIKEEQDGYTQVPGTGYFYESRFWSGMPDLNLDNPEVQDEFKNIAKFWQDLGVDGFRMDAALYYYTGSDDKNIEALKWFNEAVKENNPSAYVVAEVWANQTQYAKYYASGINSLFDFAFSAQKGVIAKVARGSKPASYFAKTVVGGEKLYKENATAEATDKNVGYLNAPFYTNHDTDRSAGFYAGDNAEDQTKLAGALNLLMSGNAFVYYGDELGMKGSGRDENKRAPMMWTSYNYKPKNASGSDEADDADDAGTDKNAETDDEKTNGMCDEPADMEKFDQIYPGLDVQEKDASSIFEYYREAIKLRNVFPVISRGTNTSIESGNDTVGILQKTDESGTYSPVYILINNSSEPQDISLSKLTDAKEPKLSAVLLTGTDEVTEKDGAILLPPYGIAVYTY